MSSSRICCLNANQLLISSLSSGFFFEIGNALREVFALD